MEFGDVVVSFSFDFDADAVPAASTDAGVARDVDSCLQDHPVTVFELTHGFDGVTGRCRDGLPTGLETRLCPIDSLIELVGSFTGEVLAAADRFVPGFHEGIPEVSGVLFDFAPL
jgi:hypothetical protein